MFIHIVCLGTGAYHDYDAEWLGGCREYSVEGDDGASCQA